MRRDSDVSGGVGVAGATSDAGGAQVRRVGVRGGSDGGRREPAEDPVLLSPRVLDQAAYESLSAELRELLMEVRRESAGLRASAEEARTARGELAEAAEKQRSTLEIATKLVKAMTMRGEQIEASLKKAEVQSGEASSLGERIDSEMRERESAFDRMATERTAELNGVLAKKLDELKAAAHREVEGARSSLTSVLTQIEALKIEFRDEAKSSAASAEASLTGLIERARMLCDAEAIDPDGPVLAAVVARAERLSGETDAAAERIGAVCRGAETLMRSLEDRLAESKMLLDMAGSRQEKASEALNAIMSAVGEAESRLGEQTARAGEVVTPVEEAVGRAREAIARLERFQEESAQVVTLSRASAEETRRLMIDVRDASSRLEQWRDLLLGRDVPEDALPEPLRKIAGRFRDEISADLSAMVSAMERVVGRGRGDRVV